MKVARALLYLCFLLPIHDALAASYYLDASLGNDAWSGKQPNPVGTSDGPWRSFARLAKTTLVPGDVIYLRCGRTWNETLKLSAAGTAISRITVTSYPYPCAEDRPTVSGFVSINPGVWTRHAPQIYKVKSPLNILRNPDFSSGLGEWRIWSPLADGQIALSSSCPSSPCMSMKSGSGTTNTVIYGDPISLVGGMEYRLRFDYAAPVGTRLRAIVRRSVPPFDILGIAQDVFGTGAWRSVSVTFVGTSSVDNARLDFELPPGGYAASVDNLGIDQQLTAPHTALLGKGSLIPAHHPNRNYAPTNKTSLYFINAANSNSIATPNGGLGSTYVTVGPEYFLPAGSALQPGASISLRTNAWMLETRTVTSVSGGRIYFDAPTSYPLKAGWGFFLTGALWMVDEPDEWYFDKADGTFYLRTAVDAAPTTAVQLASLENCVDLSATAYITLDQVGLKGCQVGVRLAGSISAELRDIRAYDIGRNAVFAPASRDVSITAALIERTGEEAILAQHTTLGVAIGMSVTDSTVRDTGIYLVNGQLVSVPRPSLGAIAAGSTAKVINNAVIGAAYHGIRALNDTLVEGNLVDSSCLILDDCGGIYAHASGHGTLIRYNVVRNLPGGLDGKPAGTNPLAQGIFLDDEATDMVVLRNTISNAENGVFLHNAHNNTVQGNVLYGNRRNQIAMLEDRQNTSTYGDVYGNSILDNLFFPTTPSAAVGHETTIRDTTRFGSYDRNRYSTLLASRVVSEAAPGSSVSFDFPGWQKAVANGLSRNQEANGSQVSAMGYAAFRVLGSSIMPNGTMTSGTTGWTPWNDSPPLATAWTSPCGATTCLEVAAGATTSLVASPPFSVRAESWYRVTFDVKANVGSQALSVLVRRGGGGTNGYESLMGNAEAITIGSSFKRYTFGFKATKTINASDPVTKDIGARLYFDRIPAGNRITLANVEIVPLSAADASMQTSLFANPSTEAAYFSCPEAATNPALCNRYVGFPTGVALSWPLRVEARSSLIGYTLDTTLIDSDGDGITDTQDQCPGTAKGDPTNARGCALSQ